MVAVIPAKGTSKRFPGKNLAEFGGIPLVVRKIRQLKAASAISKVYLATDSEQISTLGHEEDCEVLWREPEWADDEKGKSFSETIAHLAERISEKHIFWAHCTAPYIGPEIVNQSVETYWEALENNYDSLISHSPVSEYLWKDWRPLNYTPGPQHVRSQDLRGISKMTNGVLIAPRESMISWKYHHGPNPKIILIDKIASVDIDDELDFEIANFLSARFEEGHLIS